MRFELSKESKKWLKEASRFFDAWDRETAAFCRRMSNPECELVYELVQQVNEMRNKENCVSQIVLAAINLVYYSSKAGTRLQELRTSLSESLPVELRTKTETINVLDVFSSFQAMRRYSDFQSFNRWYSGIDCDGNSLGRRIQFAETDDILTRNLVIQCFPKTSRALNYRDKLEGDFCLIAGRHLIKCAQLPEADERAQDFRKGPRFYIFQWAEIFGFLDSGIEDFFDSDDLEDYILRLELLLAVRINKDNASEIFKMTDLFFDSKKSKEEFFLWLLEMNPQVKLSSEEAFCAIKYVLTDFCFDQSDYVSNNESQYANFADEPGNSSVMKKNGVELLRHFYQYSYPLLTADQQSDLNHFLRNKLKSNELSQVDGDFCFKEAYRHTQGQELTCVRRFMLNFSALPLGWKLAVIMSIMAGIVGVVIPFWCVYRQPLLKAEPNKFLKSTIVSAESDNAAVKFTKVYEALQKSALKRESPKSEHSDKFVAKAANILSDTTDVGDTPIPIRRNSFFPSRSRSSSESSVTLETISIPVRLYKKSFS